MNKYLFALCLSLFVITGSLCHAEIAIADSTIATTNVAQRNITYEEWNDLTNDDAFNYRDKIENQKIEKPRNNEGWEKFMRKVGAFLSSTAGKIIIWGMLLLVILFAVYKVLMGERSSIFGRNRQAHGGEEHTIAEDINETDWESLLNKAAKKGDLRLSVRYSYMLLLRVLQDSELISYREDKTNFQYISELAESQYKQPFRNLSRQYEYTWYGEYPISQSNYEAYIGAIMDIKKKLGR